MKSATEIMEEAGKIVVGERQESHGVPENNFARIAAMWTAFLDVPITPAQVAWMMVLLKVSRAASGHGVQDNSVDAVGYAALAGQMEGQK